MASAPVDQSMSRHFLNWMTQKKAKVFTECPVFDSSVNVCHLNDLPNEEREDCLSQMNAVIIEGGDIKGEHMLTLSLALSKGIPVLLMLPKGTAYLSDLDKLLKIKNMRHLLQVSYYHLNNGHKIIAQFYKKVNHSFLLTESPTIKFTLRITPQLYQYLTRGARHAKLSKAVYIRNILAKEIERQVLQY